MGINFVAVPVIPVTHDQDRAHITYQERVVVVEIRAAF